MGKAEKQRSISRDKRQAIVEGAMPVFARYGFARVTMADLAAAAGMSRTALYPLFDNKADVFDAVVRHQSETAVRAIHEGLEAEADLQAKLRFACEHAIVAGYLFVRSMPDAADLFEMNRSAVHELYVTIEQVLADIIAVHASHTDIDVPLLARTTTAAFRSFKQIAVDVDDLRRMIDVQIGLIVHRTGSKVPD